MSLLVLVCVSQSLWPGVLVSSWVCEGFLGRFLPILCGMSVGVFLLCYWGNCLVRLIYLVSLGPWVASAAFLGLRSSEPRGWLFVCFLVSLDIPW